jgi:hypothetical protein
MKNYDTILERIEEIAVTISLTSDPENIQILRKIMINNIIKLLPPTLFLRKFPYNSLKWR